MGIATAGWALALCAEFGTLLNAFALTQDAFLASLPAYAAGIALASLLSARFDLRLLFAAKPRKALLIALSIIAEIVLLFLSFGGITTVGSTLALALCCVVLGGLTSASMLGWFAVEQSTASNTGESIAGRAFLIASVLVAIAVHVNDPAKQIVTALFLPLSLGLHLIPADARTSSPTERHEITKLSHQRINKRAMAVAAMLSASCAYAFSSTIAQETLVKGTIGLLVLACLSTFVIWLHAKMRLIQFSQTLAVCLPVTVAALLACASVATGSEVLAAPVALAGFGFITMLSFMGLRSSSKAFGLANIKYASAMLSYYFVGFAVGTALGITTSFSPVSNGIMCSVLIVGTLALFATLPLFSYTPLEQGGMRELVDKAEYVEIGTGADRLLEACEKASKKFALTKRESDVLVLLAQGYNASAIANMLVLSKSTVKNHMDHVFKKMGVHSQQEVIGIVRSDISHR